MLDVCHQAGFGRKHVSSWATKTRRGTVFPGHCPEGGNGGTTGKLCDEKTLADGGRKKVKRESDGSRGETGWRALRCCVKVCSPTDVCLLSAPGLETEMAPAEMISSLKQRAVSDSPADCGEVLGHKHVQVKPTSDYLFLIILFIYQTGAALLVSGVLSSVLSSDPQQLPLCWTGDAVRGAESTRTASEHAGFIFCTVPIKKLHKHKLFITSVWQKSAN